MTLLKILAAIAAITVLIGIFANPGLAGAALVWMLIATVLYGAFSIVMSLFKKKD